jgi:hypothetical protein
MRVSSLQSSTSAGEPRLPRTAEVGDLVMIVNSNVIGSATIFTCTSL